MSWLDWGHLYLLVACWFAADVAVIPIPSAVAKPESWRNVLGSVIIALFWPAIVVMIVYVGTREWWRRK